MDTNGATQEGYPTPTPQWTPVPANQLAMPPAKYICRIVGAGGEGTGWIASSGRIVTAAHVVGTAATCQIWLPGELHPRVVTAIRLFPQAVGPGGVIRVGSAADLATIQVGGPPIVGGLSVGNVGNPTVLNALGYHDGVLVQHIGAAKPFGPFVAHGAHTDGGHSGGPLIGNGSVLAIHLGWFSVSRPWMPPNVQPPPLPYVNSGLVIDPHRAAFIAGA